MEENFLIQKLARTALGTHGWDIVLSDDADQKYLFITDGTNNEIHILMRENGEPLGSFGHAGRNAGQFHWVHTMAIDSHGNLFTARSPGTRAACAPSRSSPRDTRTHTGPHRCCASAK